MAESERTKLVRREAEKALTSLERSDLAKRVLSYFHQHSHAKDSADGIARFWVGENPQLVQRCLVELHTQGLLQKRTIAGTDLYSLQKDLQHPAAEQSCPVATRQTEAHGRILIVDDDPSIRAFMVDALSEAGHSVAMAEDGDRAIEMFRADPFDLVLTDLLMPGMSGIEVLQALKRHSPSTEVIVITAHAALKTAIEALRHGAYDLITKPLDDIELLYRVVERALQTRRLFMENLLLVDTLQARILQLKQTVTRLAAVNEIGKATTGLLDLQEICDALVRMVAQHLEVRRVSVLVSKPDSNTMSLVASVGITEHEVLGQRVRIGEGIAGHVAATQSPLLVTDIEKSNLNELRTGGRYTTPSFMITPLTASYSIRYQRKRVGVINVSDKHSGDPFYERDLEFLSTLASQVVVAIENARLVKEMEGGYLGALVTLIRAAEDARPETRGHSIRVAEMAAAIAREMNLAEPRIALLLQAAALHEVGRLSTRPDNSAGAKGRPRTSEEWSPAAAMAAERVLAPIASLREVREILLHSTDSFDATQSLPGVNRPSIPVESRILAVCEEFERLVVGNGHDRKKKRQALEAIRSQIGQKHDPDVVAALCHL